MAERRSVAMKEQPASPAPNNARRRAPMGGAVPTAPLPPSFWERLMETLGTMSPDGYPVQSGTSTMPGQGVVNAIDQTIMSPAKRGMDWLKNLGR